MEVAFWELVVTVATAWLLALGWRNLTRSETENEAPQPELVECERCGRLVAALERHRFSCQGRPQRFERSAFVMARKFRREVVG